MLNLVSTVGAFVFAAGVLVVVVDVLRPKRARSRRGAQPLERRHARMAGDEPAARTGACARSRMITSRYPLWEQPDFGERRRRGPLLPARRRGRPARDAGHLGARRASRSRACACRATSSCTMVAAVALGGVFISRPSTGGLRQRSSRGRRASSSILDLAVDRHRRSSRRSRRRTSGSA